MVPHSEDELKETRNDSDHIITCQDCQDENRIEALILELPNDLIRKIGSQVRHPIGLLHLAQVSAAFRAGLADARPIRHLIMDPIARSAGLDERISEFLLRTGPGSQFDHLRDLSPQDAIFLYDQLIGNRWLSQSEKDAILVELTANMPIFSDPMFALSLGFDRVGFIRSHQCKPPPPNPADLIPQPILECIQEAIISVPPCDVSFLSQDEMDAVRARYRPPFDQIFPHNRRVAFALLSILRNRRLLSLLQNSAVILALLRYGIGFPRCSFPLIDDPDLIATIYPLLRPQQTRSVTMMSAYAMQGRSDHAWHLSRVPAFIADAKRNRASFMSDMLALVANDAHDAFRSLSAQPLFQRRLGTVTQERSGRSLLHYAFRLGRVEIATLLLSLPHVQLYQTDGSGHGPLKHLMEAPCDDIERLLLQAATCPNMIELIGSDLDSAFHLLTSLTMCGGKDRCHLLGDVLAGLPSRLRVRIVTYVDHNGDTLLHKAFSVGALQCATVLLRTHGLRPSLTNRCWRTAIGKVQCGHYDGEFLDWLVNATDAVEVLLRTNGCACALSCVLVRIASGPVPNIREKIKQLPFLNRLPSCAAPLLRL